MIAMTGKKTFLRTNDKLKGVIDKKALNVGGEVAYFSANTVIVYPFYIWFRLHLQFSGTNLWWSVLEIPNF